jgi:Glycosyltransferase family 87
VRSWPRWPRLLAALVVLLLAVALAASRAERQRRGTDFHVFWQAGQNFARGEPLYERPETGRRFIYPPFAAQVFQVFALFPLKVAATLFYLANLGLIVVAARLTRDLTGARAPALGLALLLSGQFILNNLNLVQVNLVTFTLCLVGARGLIAGRPRSAGWLALAAAFKITPVFFVIWSAIRGGAAAIKTAALVGVGCLALPILQRGPARGWADLADYYRTFLGQFTAGAVVTDYTNQTLSAMVYRAVTVPVEPQRFRYDYLGSLEWAAPAMYRGLAAVILGAFLIHLVRVARSGSRVTPLEICAVFLTSHLLSGITWKAHLVTLLFVFATFFSLDRRELGAASRVALAAAWAGIGIVGLSGRDLVGDALHHYAGGYSLFVWVMLGLWTLSLCWSRPRAPG